MTIRIIYCVVLALVVALVVGCGGGGSGSDIVTPAPATGDTATTRTITGKVVSSLGAVKLSGVTVRVGGTDVTVSTNDDGSFSFTLDTTSDLPTYVQLDPSGAGDAYASAVTVLYRSQTYLTTHIDVPVDVLNGVTNDLGTITIYDMSGDTAPPPPFSSKETLLVGRVVSKQTGLGIKNVTVEFGRLSTVTAKTGAAGYFAINLGYDISVSSVYPTLSETFTIDSSTAGATYPSTLNVKYRGVTALQSAISVPTDIITGSTTDIGTLSIVDDGSTDGDTPPPPPDDGGGGGVDPPPPPV